MLSPSILARKIDDAISIRPNAYLIGIAGIPGSGKSTICRELARLQRDAVIVSMDGYHLPRSQLDAQQLRRRGAPDTFDSQAFRRDIQRLHESHYGSFPSFEHAEKDPRPDAVHVNANCPLVIVEGLYVLIRMWQCEQYFNLRVFVDSDIDKAMRRVAKRHAESGITATIEEGQWRADNYDRHNAQVILDDGCRERAELIT